MEILQKPFGDQEVLDRVWSALGADQQRRTAQAERAAFADRLKLLTPRERIVLDLLVAGGTSKEIAAELSLSVRTVESHRASIMEKMEAGSSTQLVRTVLLARAPSAAR